MTEPTYTVSPQMNQKVVQEMREANSNISTELLNLHTDLQASLKAWQSPDSKVAYEQRKQRWDAAAASMPESLNHASATLERMTDRMVRTENNLAVGWGQR